jgi:small nuclear ribonucleoprotein (snRNP)-like protein
MTIDEARALLGQQVEVTLADKVIAIGQLLAFDDGGECVLQDEMGFTHWCWPMLNIRPCS